MADSGLLEQAKPAIEAAERRLEAGLSDEARATVHAWLQQVAHRSPTGRPDPV